MRSENRRTRDTMRSFLPARSWPALVAALAVAFGVLAPAPPAQAQDAKPPPVENLRCVAKTKRVAFLWDAPEWSGGEASSYDYDLTLPDGRSESARIKGSRVVHRPGTYRTGAETRVSIRVNYEVSGGGTVTSDEETLVCYVRGDPRTPVTTSTTTPEPEQGTPDDVPTVPTTIADATDERTPQDKYADLIARMYEWRNDPRWSSDKSHTDRWDRALLALGETVADTTLTALTAAEAQGFADRGWTRWVDVAAALEDTESGGQQQGTSNRPPTVSAPIADVTIVNESGTRRVSLSGVFSDADSDSLTVTAASSDEAVATVAVASDGSALTVTAAARGAASVTVTADDGNGGTASDAFTVTVKTAPVVASALADVSGLEVGATQDVSLAGVFSDADSDSLTVTATPSNQAVAAVAVALDGSMLTVDGVAEGTATITVTAEDSDGNRVGDAFDVTVTAPQPREQTPQEEHADLIARMYEWRDDPQHSSNKSHTDRWDRALMALGETVADTALIPMTAAEAQELADRGWTRWVDVAEALKNMPPRSQWVYRFIESNVVEKYEDEHPWLRETWDGMEREKLEVVLTPLPDSTIMQVNRCRSVPGHLIRCGKHRLEVNPKHARNVRAYVHELAHFWTVNFGVVAEPAAPIAMGHLYFNHLKNSTGCDSPALELFAEAITYAVVGYIHSPYWCSGMPPLHAEEVQNVTNSVLGKQTPQWFIDEYQNQNGSWKLDELWADIKSLRRADLRKTGIVFHFSKSFGEYCLWHYSLISNDIDLISNPWRDANGGFCNPSAPQNAAITPGDSQLTVSWEAPVDDGGSSITGYALHWWSGTRWVNEVTSETSYTITGLDNGSLYTVSVCARTLFSDCGGTAYAKGTPTDTPPDATEPEVVAPEPPPANQAPTVVSALADATIVSESGTLEVSLAGVFSDADDHALTVIAASSNDAVATVSVASDGSTLTVNARARGTATVTATAADGNGGTVEDTFTVTVKAAPVVASALADVSDLEVDATQEVSLSGVFSDADGDTPTITAASSNEAVATVSPAADGSALTLTGVAAGTATITVTARDADGNQAHDDFAVTVTALPRQGQQPPAEDEPETTDIVAQYDANGDGAIDVNEYISALRAYAQGLLTKAERDQIIDAYLAWAHG